MKYVKKGKSFFLGFLSCLIIVAFTTTVLAGTGLVTIQVTFDSINITVNGKPVNQSNILYNGTTYAPLRSVAEMLGYEVGWDQNTKTANISNQESSIGQQWVLKTSKFVSVCKNSNEQYVDTISAPIEGEIYGGRSSSSINQYPLDFEFSFFWTPAPENLKPETSYYFDLSANLVNYYDKKDYYAYPFQGMIMYWGYRGVEDKSGINPGKPLKDWYLSDDYANTALYEDGYVKISTNPDDKSPTSRKVYFTTPKHEDNKNTIYVVVDVPTYGYWMYEYDWVN